VWKRRAGDHGLVTDRSVASPDEVVAFSEACRAAARAGYARGGRCVTAALRGNTLCGNRRVDLASAGAFARWGSTDDRCGTVEGARCAQTCDGVPAPVMSVAAPRPAARAVAAPAAIAGVDAGAGAPVPAAGPAASTGWRRSTVWMGVGGGVLALFVGWYISVTGRRS
jgi:hypothetical protein